MFSIACEYLLEVCGVQEEVIDCVATINGSIMESLENVLYWATGYRSFDQADDWEEWAENF